MELNTVLGVRQGGQACIFPTYVLLAQRVSEPRAQPPSHAGCCICIAYPPLQIQRGDRRKVPDPGNMQWVRESWRGMDADVKVGWMEGRVAVQVRSASPCGCGCGCICIG